MKKEASFQQIVNELPQNREKLVAMREIFLANLIMISEIPAPTFHEQPRADFLIQRFSEAGLLNPSTDEQSNALGILQGEQDDSAILMVAHLDTLHSGKIDHTVTVKPDGISGPGIADNSLGLAATISLPRILNLLDIQLQSNLILMGASRSLGRGNLEGLRFFLSNNELPIKAGICVEGARLGRLNYRSIGMLRGDVICSVPDEYDWTQFGARGAIGILNDVINKIYSIPLPKKPTTQILLGAVSGGNVYNRAANDARLSFEIQSDSDEMIVQLEKTMHNIADEVTYNTRAKVEVDAFARREAGGIEFAHPLVQRTRSILTKMNQDPFVYPSTSELSAFIDKQTPAITVGISKADHLAKENETVFVDSIFTGLAQLVGILLAVDRGCCDVD